MAKKTANRSRAGSNNQQNNQSNSLLSSILGMFNFGNINVCTSNDQGFYCVFMRYFQLLISIIVILVILYVIYTLVFKPSNGLKLFGGKIRK